MTSEAPLQATEDTWMYPPADGWTYDQVKDLELPFDWELVDGVIVARGMTKLWHNGVRDKVVRHLGDAAPEPYAAVGEQCVLVDEHNPPKPDIVVYDTRDLDFFQLECVPVDKVALVVEVVSPGSQQDDRVRKPALFAKAAVPFYWRVERERDDRLAVHEFWIHHENGTYMPAPLHPVHRDKLITDVPFPVEIDLRALAGH